MRSGKSLNILYASKNQYFILYIYIFYIIYTYICYKIYICYSRKMLCHSVSGVLLCKLCLLCTQHYHTRLISQKRIRDKVCEENREKERDKQRESERQT